MTVGLQMVRNPSAIVRSFTVPTRSLQLLAADSSALCHAILGRVVERAAISTGFKDFRSQSLLLRAHDDQQVRPEPPSNDLPFC